MLVAGLRLENNLHPQIDLPARITLIGRLPESWAANIVGIWIRGHVGVQHIVCSGAELRRKALVDLDVLIQSGIDIEVTRPLYA